MAVIGETVVDVPWDFKASEIDTKKKDLERRATELVNMDGTLGIDQESGEKPANWPSIYPLVHHDIQEQIPSNVRILANQSYLIAKLTAAAYILNMIVSMIFIMTGTGGIFGAIVSSFYAALMTAFSFFGWHLSLYNAFKKRSGLWYALFFALFVVHLGIVGLAGIGLIDGAAGGMISIIGAIATGNFIATVLISACTGLFVFIFLAGVYLAQGVARSYWSRDQIGRDLVEGAAANPGIVMYALNNMA